MPPSISRPSYKIDKQLAAMSAREGALKLANPKDPTSGDARAWTQNPGAGATIIFGAAFSAAKFDVEEWASTLVHELAHAEGEIRGRDFAYAGNRLFARLPPELALRNPDSYAALVGRLNGSATPQLPERPPGSEDKAELGATREQLDAVQDALAWIERFASASFSTITDVYTRVAGNGSEPLSAEHEVAKILTPLAGRPDAGLGYRVALVGIRDVFGRLRRACECTVDVWLAEDDKLTYREDISVVNVPTAFKGAGRTHVRAVLAALLEPLAGERTPDFIAVADQLGRRKELPGLD